MAFVVEDGTGLTNATSYVSVAEFRAHHADRGRSTAEFSDADVQVKLVLATDYVDQRWGKRLRGWKRSQQQSLEVPRNDFFDDDGHLYDDRPAQLVKAVSEYALLALQLERELAPLPAVEFSTVDPETGTVTDAQSGGGVRRTREKVGPIEEEKEYAEPRVARTSGNALVQHAVSYPQADLWMEELLRPRGTGDLQRG